MASLKIAVIPGDNVGPEVIREGLKCLRATAEVAGAPLEFTEFPWGVGHYLRTGEVMPEDGLQTLQQYDAIYLGAVGDPQRVPDHIAFTRGVVQRVRRGFDQYVNLRPAKLLPGVTSPLRAAKDMDLVIVRENTEGEYAWMGGRHYTGTPEELVTQVSIFTRRGTERVMRFAFELARRRRKSVSSVTKSNALHYSMVFWDQIFAEVAREYPDVAASQVYADAMAIYLITRPETYDVIVASNLFGDILSDEAAAVQGSIGLAAGANLNPERQYPSMFEPIHGSAPDIAGQGIANPIGAIAAGQLMLSFLGEEHAADLLQRAIEEVLAEGKVRTPDLGGSSRTWEVGDAISVRVQEIARRPAI